MTTEDLPNLSLLIKLLKLSGSSNDAEALLAIRKANEQLSRFGGNWETLLRSHVTIIGADPFAEIATPPPSTRSAPYRAAPAAKPSPFRPPPKPPRSPQPPPQQAQAPQPPQPWTPPSPRPNRYAGHCFACGYNVPISDGTTRYLGTQSSGKWEVFCAPCNIAIEAGAAAIPKRRAPKRTSLKDALSQI